MVRPSQLRLKAERGERVTYVMDDEYPSGYVLCFSRTILKEGAKGAYLQSVVPSVVISHHTQVGKAGAHASEFTFAEPPHAMVTLKSLQRTKIQHPHQINLHPDLHTSDLVKTD